MITKKININFIINIIVIYSILLAVCSISRVYMANSFISDEVLLNTTLNKMYFYGFLYDSRVLSIALSLYLIYLWGGGSIL
ncbi:hypothetical protein [Helicobacter sp. MIT 14-3879]|uniref:hypothetical protein n=1 Tax=Helicobacter sp. MIT 14-3879 TaxID=2040649 RepID=UPI000E1EF0FD|nr:hypothetical protein [Helicobacter sp. MIT 14-3879]RDU63529.1 hypothetical protein CQA44_05445 [Helicobacter sp. MIT 14-3879]